MAYIHQINKFDIDNDFGQGPVVSVFFNFCSFHCPQCWNQDTWDRKEDLYWDNDEAVRVIVDALQTQLIKRGMKPNLSLLGGDPIVTENIDSTIYIIDQVRKQVPDVKISVWTGFDIEDWYKTDKFEKQKTILPRINYLIDGRFVYQLKTKNQMFGSINQRVIDTQKFITQNLDIKENIITSLAYPNVHLSVIEKSGYHTTPFELMQKYIQSDYRSYTRSVLADVKAST